MKAKTIPCLLHQRRMTLASSLGLLAAIGLCAAGPPQGKGPGVPAEDPGRENDPVVVSGARFPELYGRPLDELALYRFDPDTQRFTPIPFQVDERLAKVFNPGTPGEFTETMYDVFGEEDETLDADDELVFLFGDAGDQAPAGVEWLASADPLRFEIAAEDPRPEGSVPTRWVYLFSGPGLPLSPVSYMSWDGQVDSSMSSDLFQLDYEGRWLLTGFRLHAPCGDGGDLIDRFKGRARPRPDLVEDELDWDLNSEYLGGISGPLRAIRYVRGARSGVNTIHHDVMYRGSWMRRINLRTHELLEVWFYFDWLPQSGMVFLSEAHTGGILVDGVPDGGVTTAFQPWQQVVTPAGGFHLLIDMPPSPYYAEKRFYYLDDASFDDDLGTKPVYGDDDDSAYGDHGAEILDLGDSNLDAIPIELHLVPFCSGDGGLELALTLNEEAANPLAPEVVPQQACGAIRTLTLQVEATDVVLTWQPVLGAEGYRVYTASFPDLPQGSWDLQAEGAQTSYRDVGGAAPGRRFYSVAPVCTGDEGPW